MNNIEYFKKQVKYWSKKFKLGKINIYPNYKMWFTALIEYEDGTRNLWYNANNLRGISKCEVLRIVFHELGHFKHPIFNKDHNYEYYEYMLAEYLAESQMFKWLKKYYPRYYTIVCNDCKWITDCCLSHPKKYRYYFEAFSQIPEYVEHL